MAEHNTFGANAEKVAAKYLEDKGYEILEENWTHGKYEVDLIAYLNGTIIFVEVKARSSDNFGQPEDFVDDKKQLQLAKAAAIYVELMDHENEIRFDIIALLYQKNGLFKLNHIEDAFWPD